MKFHIQYLSTRSGKTLLLFFDKHRYVFNLFEGFQRYSIEANVKLTSVTAFFLSTKYQIPALLGTYLTLNECKSNYELPVNVICSADWFNIINSANFANKRKLKFNLCTSYKDSLIEVKMIEIEDECSFIVKLPIIRGKMLMEKIPQNFPKKMLSLLAKRKEVIFENKLIKDAFLPDIHPKSIGIVYSTKNFEKLIEIFKKEKIENIFFFQRKALLCFKKEYKGNLYYCNENYFVEFISFYEIQREFNKFNKNYLLPSKLKEVEKIEDVLYLNSKDVLLFNKEINDYEHIKNVQMYPEGIKEQIYNENDIFITFLGTGCAIPSKYRNVSGILVQIKDILFLLDCGEDTLWQIHRIYNSFDIVDKLSFIFISHSHADHNLGIISVLMKRKNKSKLKIFGPSKIFPFIQSFTNNFTFISTDETFLLRKKIFLNYSDYFTSYDFNYLVSLCGVLHCEDSCGIKVIYEGFTISYSGDTKYDTVFKEMIKNSDVLIHEATFTDDLREKADKTYHSTVLDAVRVAEEGNVKQLILTHFSQRKRENVIGDTLDLYKIIPDKFL